LVGTYLNAEQRLALLAEQRALRDVAELVEAHVRARRHLCELRSGRTPGAGSHAIAASTVIGIARRRGQMRLALRSARSPHATARSERFG
jgi:hypothetical protein